MVEVIFAKVKIKYILDPISKKEQSNYAINNFIGKTGGNSIDHLSTEGTTLSFKSIVSKNESSLLKSYRKLQKTYASKAGVLAGSSDLDVDGNYFLVDYNEEKQVNGSYVVSWEFLEYVKPNIVKKTFKRIGKSAKKSTNKNSKKNTSAKKPSKYIISLLSVCGTMQYGMVNKKCVKYLQKFLQKKGYYKNCKIDGDYLSETKKAVNQMQKAYKIKVSKSNQGQWDKVTRNYWRKKYNITSKKKAKEYAEKAAKEWLKKVKF